MPANVKRKHGRSVYFIQNEGVYVDDPFAGTRLGAPRAAKATPAEIGRMRGLAAPAATPPAGAAAEPAPPQSEEQATAGLFRFVRMFPDLPKFDDAPEEGLIALGQSMGVDSPAPDHSNLPAGFTYLGQFVDHDITFDGEALEDADANLDDTINKRSPSLDLDSVYGAGPVKSPELYDGDKLKIGQTTPSAFGNAPQVLPNDLLRGLDTARPTTAALPDPRNDENLAVAQTHLAFMTFHNRVVDTLGLPFAEARAVVLQHYQAVVWFDFLPRLLDPLVWLQVHLNGRQFFDPGSAVPTGELGMPIEFSAAGYRIGHSMIRSAYEWNRVFSTGNPFGAPTGTLQLLFQFTGNVPPPGMGLQGPFDGTAQTLNSNWVVDWTRLADFTAKPAIGNPNGFNRTRRLDTHLVEPLQQLPEFMHLPEDQRVKSSLAVRNLLRGKMLGLPSGQDVATAIGVTPLKPAEVLGGAHDAVLTTHGFDVRTPLWFYVLREAEVQQDGLRLGAVGSLLIAETFHRLIEASDHSIFATPNWVARPELRPTNPKTYALHDLLDFAFDGQLNPLGDA